VFPSSKLVLKRSSAPGLRPHVSVPHGLAQTMLGLLSELRDRSKLHGAIKVPGGAGQGGWPHFNVHPTKPNSPGKLSANRGGGITFPVVLFYLQGKTSSFSPQINSPKWWVGVPRPPPLLSVGEWVDLACLPIDPWLSPLGVLPGFPPDRSDQVSGKGPDPDLDRFHISIYPWIFCTLGTT